MSAVSVHNKPFSVTKLENFSQTNNTQWDIVSEKIKLSTFRIEDIKNFINVIN